MSLTAFQNLNPKKLVEGMFDKSLRDLVQGIRAHKQNEEHFIKQCIHEIRQELKSPDMRRKAVAVQKATYLYMLGYPVEDSAFHIVEVMSQPKFHLKRVGYLAASQTFTQTTDVIMLTTQLLRRDMKSLNQYESGLAISGLSMICTPDLARDLVSEVVALMNSQRPYIRKKAVLVLFKIFLQYPDALRPSFPKLKEKLTDTHPSVVSAAVNVVCELARKNPQNYLGMAPVFFKLMTTLNNNWTVIKIVKLFGALTPHEPRLAKKLVEPLTNMINTTPAKSLLYECLHTVTKGMQKHPSIVKLAVEKLKLFVQDPDQNLKYLGLLGLSNLLGEYPKIIADLKDVILDCMEDEDITIRHRALDLLTGVVSKKNINSIMQRLMKYAQAAEGDYRNYLVEKIITTCAKGTYENVSNFKWYLQLLVDLTELKGIEHGALIAAQIMDVLIRVKSVRAHGVSEMIKLLSSSHIHNENAETSNIFEVLYAAAWITGEFIGESQEDPRDALDSLLNHRISALPSRIQICYVQAVIKLFAAAAASKKLQQSTSQAEQQEVQPELDLLDELEKPAEQKSQNVLSKSEKNKKTQEMREAIQKGFEQFLTSPDVEVQERVSCCLKLIEIHASLLESGTDIGDQLSALFEDALNPIVAGSNKRVPKPENLNLDDWINEPFDADINDDIWEGEGSHAAAEEEEEVAQAPAKIGTPISKEEDEKVRSKFMLGKGKSQPKSEVAVVPLSDILGTEKPKKKKAAPKKAKKKVPVIEENVEIIKEAEMPEGALPEQTEEFFDDSVTDKLSKISLTDPISPEEQLYTPAAYPTAAEQRELAAKKQQEAQKKPAPEAAKKGTKKAAAGEKKTTKKKAAATGEKKATKKKAATAQGEQKGDMLDFLTGAPAETATTTAAPAEEKKAPAKKQPKVVKKRLCKDDNITLTYVPLVMPTDANHITIPIYFENVSAAPLANVDFDVDSETGVKLVRPGEKQSGAVRAFVSLPPGTQTVAAQFKFTSVTTPHRMTGYVEYGPAGQRQKNKFVFTLPVSTFVAPKMVTAEDVPALAKKLPLHASSKFALPAKEGTVKDVDGAATEIARLLRLAIVQKMPGTAFLLAGATVQNHQILVQLKALPENVSVEIKCSDDKVATNLLKEVDAFLKK